jgi:hypothetical protein
MIITFLLSLLCSTGWYYVKFNVNFTELLSSSVNKKVSIFEDRYYSRFNQSGYLSFNVSSKHNILTKEFLLKLWDLEQKLFSASTSYQYSSVSIYTIKDFCIPLLNRTLGTSCYYSSPTLFWDNREQLEHDPDILKTITLFKVGFCQQVIDVDSVFGGLSLTHNKYTFSNSASFIFYTQVSSGDDLKIQILEDLEYTFDRIIEKESVFYSNMTFSYITPSTFKRQVSSSANDMLVNLILCAVAFCLIPIIFVPHLNPNGNFISKLTRKVSIGLLITFNCVLSIFASVGFCTFFGVHVNPVSLQVIPFFIFGISADNAFLLISVYQGIPGTIEEKTRSCLRIVGYSLFCGQLETVLLISLCLIMEMNFLNDLCIDLIVAILFNAVFQLLSLLPFLNILNNTDNSIKDNEKHLEKVKKFLFRVFKLLQQNTMVRRGIVIVFGLLTIIFSIFAVTRSSIDVNLKTVYGNSDILSHIPVFLVLNNLPISEKNQTSLNLLGDESQFRSSLNWVQSLRLWMTFKSDAHIEEPYKSKGLIPPNIFVPYLNSFLDDRKSGGVCMKLNFHQNVSQIIGSVLVNTSGSLHEMYNNFKTAQASLESKDIDGFFFWPLYRFSVSMFDGLEMKYIIITITGNALVSALNFILNYNQKKLIFLSSVSMLSYQLIVIGIMAVSSIPLNPFTITNLIISIGVYIDFNNCVIMCIKYKSLICTSKEDPSSNQTISALVQSNYCLIWSFIGSISGLLFLIFGPIEILRLYFLNVYSIILAACMALNFLLISALILEFGI